MMKWQRFGERLRQALDESGVTQKQLAEWLGVKPPTVNQWVKGKSYPRSDVLGEICDKLEVSADELLLGSKPNHGYKHPWLISLDEMHFLEGNAQHEVWVITKSLENDVPGGEFFQSVRDNAEKGVKYTYIVPMDDETVRCNIDEVKRITFKSFQNLCQIIEVADFDRVVLYNHAVFFDPYVTDYGVPLVYHQLPLHKGSLWWIRLEENFARKFIGQIKLLIDGTSSKS